MAEQVKLRCFRTDCSNCYRHLRCWACSKADAKNGRTCGEVKLKEHKEKCFSCNLK